MLNIEEGDEVPLPKQYHRLHNISVMLHDQMAVITKHEDYKWFQEESLEYPDNHTDAVVRDVVQALLVDFLHFAYESLNAAKKGKISVAYALLRKPVTDLLLLFEQILANKEEFVIRFTEQDPATYDPSHASLDKKTIVTDACAKLMLSDMFDAEFVHDLRYDKTSKWGIASSVHQALHIVTRNKYYPTPHGYFNFVFDTQGSLEQYWRNYYNVVSYLLCYAAAVMDEIAFDFMPEHYPVKHMKNIQRVIFFMEIMKTYHSDPEEDERFTFENLGVKLAYTCQNCGHNLAFTQEYYALFTREMALLCLVCTTDQFQDEEFQVKFHEAWAPVVPI